MLNTIFPTYRPKYSGYTFAPSGLPNGNAKSRAGRTLTWDVQNRAHRAPEEVTNGSTTEESYLYDPRPVDTRQRVKKTSNGVSTFYVNQLYEVSGSAVTKYYAPQGLPGNQRDTCREPCSHKS